MSLNKIMLIGHLGKDPDVRTLDGGAKVASFPLATTDKAYTLQNGTQVPERTEWHNIAVWNKMAENAEKYLHKGDKLYVEGKVRTRTYDDKNGTKHYITEVFADYMEMLSPKPQQPVPATSQPLVPTNQNQPAQPSCQQPPSYQQSPIPDNKDDLPF